MKCCCFQKGKRVHFEIFSKKILLSGCLSPVGVSFNTLRPIGVETNFQYGVGTAGISYVIASPAMAMRAISPRLQFTSDFHRTQKSRIIGAQQVKSSVESVGFQLFSSAPLSTLSVSCPSTRGSNNSIRFFFWDFFQFYITNLRF